MTERKTPACPVGRREFKVHARPVRVKIDDMDLSALPKSFSTGSLGFHYQGKVGVVVNGKMVTVQVGLNMTIVGSKDLPPEE